MYRDVRIVGYYGEGNFGDDVIAYYTIKQVCQVVSPERVMVTAPEGSYLEEWFPGIQGIERESVFKSLPRRTTKLVYGGGGQFYSFQSPGLKRAWAMRRLTRERILRLLSTYFWPRLGLLKVYAFCVGVGPLEGAKSRVATRALFRTFEQASVRDFVSLKLLTDMGVNNARLSIDPSFGMIDELDAAPAATDRSVGIVIRRWPFALPQETASLIARLQSAAQALRAQEARVEFISFQQGYDDDILETLEALGETVRTWAPRQETVAEFCRYLSGFRTLVSMRAHGVYLGAVLGAVPVGIDIEPKLSITAARCGFEEFVLHPKSSPDDITAMILRAMDAYPTRRDWQGELSILRTEAARLRDWLESSTATAHRHME